MRVYINGSNNTICIGERNWLDSVDFFIEDNDNLISLGAHNSIEKHTHLDAIEGTKIEIGDDCMISRDVNIRTGDGHAVFALNTNLRVNQSKNVKIGNHVWVGMRTIVLKGCEISSGSIVGASSVVTKSFLQTNIAIAGNPAVAIKQNVCWKRERE